MGYIERRQFSGSVDASVVALYSPHTATNTTEWAYKTLTSSYVNSISTGTVVYKEGYAGTLSSGTVQELSCNRTYSGQVISNLLRCSYTSYGGDSGGIVYTMVGSSYVAVGITVAKDSGGSYCCMAKYIIPALGLTLY